MYLQTTHRSALLFITDRPQTLRTPQPLDCPAQPCTNHGPRCALFARLHRMRRSHGYLGLRITTHAPSPVSPLGLPSPPLHSAAHSSDTVALHWYRTVWRVHLGTSIPSWKQATGVIIRFPDSARKASWSSMCYDGDDHRSVSGPFPRVAPMQYASTLRFPSDAWPARSLSWETYSRRWRAVVRAQGTQDSRDKGRQIYQRRKAARDVRQTRRSPAVSP